MDITEAAAKSSEVAEGVERDYRVGFINNDYPDGDETELTAAGLEDLKEVWESICPEFGVKPDSVTYVEGVPFDPLPAANTSGHTKKYFKEELMIRYIYEITETQKDIDYISADILTEQGNALAGADAFKDMEGAQGNELRIAFIARFAALGCSSPDLLHSFVLTSGARAKYFANRFTEVKEYVNNMTLRTFAGTDLRKLCGLIEDNDGAVVYYDNTLYPLDRWLRIAPLKQALYVGNIIAAHC